MHKQWKYCIKKFTNFAGKASQKYDVNKTFVKSNLTKFPSKRSKLTKLLPDVDLGDKAQIPEKRLRCKFQRKIT